MKKNHALSLGFDTLRLEGGLLLPDILEKAAQGKLQSQQPSDYQIPKGLKLQDEYSRAFRIAVAQWRTFTQQQVREDVDQSLVTRQFVLELLKDVLGYRDLVQQSVAIELNERHYPIDVIAFGSMPVVIAAHDMGLDQTSECFAITGGGSRKKSAFQLAQEFLNASDTSLWGIVSNGKQLRLLRDASTLTRPSFIEFDLQAILEGERYPDFAAFWRLMHGSLAGQPGASVDDCYWERWRNEGLQEGVRVRDGLRQGVEAALLSLGQGFIEHPANGGLRHDLLSGALQTSDYYQQLLRLVYRLIFLFTVEERGLLHPDHEGVDLERLVVRKAYHKGYSQSRLRSRCMRNRAYDRHHDLWDAQQVVFRGLAVGEPLLDLPALGGLFAAEQCTRLDSALLSNAALLQAIKHLRWSRRSGQLAPVDYANMASEEMGSVYEGLLELVPVIDVHAREFDFVGRNDEGSTKGNARKLSGSYYTPDALVQELIKSALEPVIKQRLAANSANPVAALLSIKVVDPACGSGHFLLAAANRLAQEVAEYEAHKTDGVVTPQTYRHALREVISHCIYGVDKNPLAVELARTALWLSGYEAGMPLSFLDHHIRCGDALLGVLDPAILEGGIPEKAYVALTGDDKAVAKKLKAENKKALTLFEESMQSDMFNKSMRVEAFGKLEDLPDGDLAEVKTKQSVWRAEREKVRASLMQQLADMYVAAFLMPKIEEYEALAPLSSDLWMVFQGERLPSATLLKIKEICKEAQVFHWWLEFPYVHEQGGFDCVLGNPPWDIVQARDSSLEQTKLDRDKLWYGVGHYSILSGRRDLYKLFLAIAPKLLNNNGILGFVLPVGFMFEGESSKLRSFLFRGNSVLSIAHIQNWRKKFFPDVHASYRFVLLSLSRRKLLNHKFSPVVKSPTDLKNISWFEIPYENLGKILGSDFGAALFNDIKQARIHRAGIESLRLYSQLSYNIVAEFHASSDKSILSLSPQSDFDWRLLKNSTIHYYQPYYAEAEKFISISQVSDRLVKKGLSHKFWMQSPKLVFRDIARNDDARTLIVCLVPPGFASTYDTPMIVPNFDEKISKEELAFYTAFLGSYFFDFLVRPYVDKHIKKYILCRLPIPAFDKKNSLMRCMAKLSLSLFEESIKKDIDLLYTDYLSESRIMIDALSFRLSGLGEEDIKEILGTFKVIKNQELKEHGCFLSENLIIEAWGKYKNFVEPLPGIKPKLTYSPKGIPRSTSEAWLAGLVLDIIQTTHKIERLKLEWMVQRISAHQQLTHLLSTTEFTQWIPHDQTQFTDIAERIPVLIRFLKDEQLIREVDSALVPTDKQMTSEWRQDTSGTSQLIELLKKAAAAHENHMTSAATKTASIWSQYA